ncbi:MAG: TlpA family protein disulfide reductase [Planctomycetaceae bacterium]
MKLRLRGLLMLCLLVGGLGCQQSAEPPTDGTSAEVPGPGEAIDLGDPGPPPEGQTEPPVADPSTDAAHPAAEGSTTVTAHRPVGESADVQLTITDWAGVQKLIAGHRGKVVVVDLWSTSCIPCRKEFPNLVKLHQEQPQAVACISVSTDYDGIPSKPVETSRDKVLKFLTSQHATFENVLCSTPAEDLFNTLKIGSIPAVYVYNQSGQLAKVFADPVDGEEFTYEHQIRPFVQNLLGSR